MAMESQGADTLFRYLKAVDDSPIRTAFGTLDSYAYINDQRAARLDAESGAVLSERHERVQNDFRNGVRARAVLQVDSSGKAPEAALPFVLPAEWINGQPNDYAEWMYPENPSFLSERTRQDYRFRLKGDTLLNGRRTRIISAQALPSLDSEQAIMYARLYVDELEQRLVAARWEYRHNALLYGEQSRFYIQVVPAPNGGWLPRKVQASNRFTLPLSKPRWIMNDITFGRFSARGDSASGVVRQ